MAVDCNGRGYDREDTIAQGLWIAMDEDMIARQISIAINEITTAEGDINCKQKYDGARNMDCK